MSTWVEPVSLKGKVAGVETLSKAHLADLIESTRDGDLHRLWYTSVPGPDGVEAEIERRLALRESGSMMPFAILDRATGRAVGMTTYMHIDAPNRRLEIGSTWYRRSVQRSAMNTECKLLLLRHAFVELNCIAVEFRTHFMNMKSRQAISRLGAKLDGVLRSHQIMANDTIRDTAVYSIVAPEWPSVEANLQWQLDKPR